MPSHMVRASSPIDSTIDPRSTTPTFTCVVSPHTVSEREEPVPVTPTTPRVKRPYNKKIPRAQVLVAPSSFFAAPFPHPQGGQGANGSLGSLGSQGSLRNHSGPGSLGDLFNHSTAVPPLNLHYVQEPSVFSSASPPASDRVSERASSDSGTDDESLCKGESAHRFADGNISF